MLLANRFMQVCGKKNSASLFLCNVQSPLHLCLTTPNLNILLFKHATKTCPHQHEGNLQHLSPVPKASFSIHLLHVFCQTRSNLQVDELLITKWQKWLLKAAHFTAGMF